jgi:hypothetical protein
MPGRFMMLLGVVAIAAATAVAGMAQPASADLVFGAVDGAGNCIAHVPTIPAAICEAGTGVPLSPTEDWISPSGLPVTTQSFDQAGTPINQFLTPSPIGGTAQSGLGIADAIDHAIAVGDFVDISTPASRAGSGGLAAVGMVGVFPGENLACAQSSPGPFAVPDPTARCVSIGFTVIPEVVETQLDLGPFEFLTICPKGEVFCTTVSPSKVIPMTGAIKISTFDVVPVPEPGALVLLLTGVAGLVLARKRRNSV